MMPDVPVVLDAALRNLGRLGVDRSDPIRKMALDSFEALMGILLQEWDDLAAARVREIESLADLLRRGAELAPEECALGWHTIAEESMNARMDLRLSSLDDVLCRLHIALIDLQAWLETAEVPEAEALLAETWSVVAVGVRRRADRAPSWF